jgi:hypothetical protein
MKHIITFFLLLILIQCSTIKEIPPPLKGSYENPIIFQNKQDVISCLKTFEKKSGLKIQYIDTVVGIDFHLIDVFSFPYKKWLKVHKIQKIDLLENIPDEYHFYIDFHHNQNECENKSLDNLIEFPE